MRDYDNMPVLQWQGEISARKAMAQVRHAEPVVIQMPGEVRLEVDPQACGCTPGDAPGHHLDCDAHAALEAVAAANGLPELARLGEVAREAGQVVDLLVDRGRIVIHD